MLEEENELIDQPTDPPDNQNTGNATTPDLDLDSVEEERTTADPPDNQRNSGG